MRTNKIFPEGLIGKKLGMTQIFNEEGESIPVTAIQVGPCFVLGVKDSAKDGYSAVQLGFDKKEVKRANKPDTGHFAKAGKGAFYCVKEVRCDVEQLGWGELGKELGVTDAFNVGQKVDVSGVSIGRGFSGVVRRYRVAGQPASRGTHEYFRHIGSIGCRKSPGRVFKNRKMPGQHGNSPVTIQNLKVVGIREEDNVILVKGAVPGAKDGYVVVRRSLKGLTADNYKAPAQAA